MNIEKDLGVGGRDWNWMDETMKEERLDGSEEKWREWYERRLGEAYTDITRGLGQYKFSDFESNFEIGVSNGVGEVRKLNGLRLIWEEYPELRKNLEGLTRSIWKLHSNAVAVFERRKSFDHLVSMREGRNPNYHWYDLGVEDFENFKKLGISEEISEAFALYLRMGVTVDPRYNPEGYSDPKTWQIDIDGEICRNLWASDSEGKPLKDNDLNRVRRIVKSKCGSDLAEKIAFSLIYATDLSGAFGKGFTDEGNDWSSASRTLYYPFDELDRSRKLSDGFKSHLKSWGGMKISFMDKISDGIWVNEEGGEVKKGEKGDPPEGRIRLMDFWLNGGFDKVGYIGCGFRGTNYQTYLYGDAAKFFELMSADPEEGENLVPSKLSRLKYPFRTVIGERYSDEVQFLLQRDWLWDQLEKWENSVFVKYNYDYEGKPLNNEAKRNLRRRAMRGVIEGALENGFLLDGKEEISKKIFRRAGHKINTYKPIRRYFGGLI